MRKKYKTIGLIGILLIALVYTLYSNLFNSKASNREGEAVENTGHQEIVNEELLEEHVKVNYEYVQIDELSTNDEIEDDHHDHDHDHDHTQQPEVRSLNIEAPDFELKTLDGDLIKLSDLRGKKVFINFWATWCPPCKEEMPHIQKYFDNLKDDNVAILAINTTDMESGTDEVRKFVEEFQLTFPILLDEKGDVSINYELLTIPTSVIINEQGTVVEQIIGPVTEEMLEERLGS